LRNIDEFLKRILGVESYIAEDSLLCVAKGSGIILNHLDTYKKTLLNKNS
jgi:rod shape-determining protein MreB and related proteins